MKRTSKIKIPTADELGRMVDRGEDISKHFTNKGKMMPPVRRVNVDFAEPMLDELDQMTGELNVSRQAVIKSLLRQALDQHYLASKQVGR